ncbi:MAG: FecR domain-containing protein [Myxococcaceae bacterium]
MSPEPNKPLASHLQSAVSEPQLSATWAEIESSRSARGQRTAWRRGAVLAFAVAVAAVAGVALWPRSPGELAQSDGQAFHRVAAAETVRLADDSRIVTTEHGAVEVLENSKAKLALHLMSGAARFEVTPGTGRHWSVEAGELSVEVTGTIFTVERGTAGAKVTVERGTVIVRGARVPDGVRRLTAGEELSVGPIANAAPAPTPAPVPVAEAAPVAVPAPTPVVVAVPVHPPPPAPPPVMTPEPAPAIEEPTASIAPSPPSPPPLLPAPVAAMPRAPPQSPASVMADADRLRREGRQADAIALLASVTDRWPGSPEAPLAALTAANLSEDSGNLEAAHHWYQRALDLGLSGPLAETARQALNR